MNIRLSSGKSRRVSLRRIKEKKSGLSQRRNKLLSRVPNIDDWAKFKVGTIKNIDLAYLTAKTGHEFALLRGKTIDVLFHGEKGKCEFDEVLSEMLISKKLRLEAHSHPEEIPVPSRDDRNTLERIGQNKSIIVSAVTGQETVFTRNQF